jgi:hypothetical protein
VVIKVGPVVVVAIVGVTEVVVAIVGAAEVFVAIVGVVEVFVTIVGAAEVFVAIVGAADVCCLPPCKYKFNSSGLLLKMCNKINKI